LLDWVAGADARVSEEALPGFCGASGVTGAGFLGKTGNGVAVVLADAAGADGIGTGTFAAAAARGVGCACCGELFAVTGLVGAKPLVEV
jgi:hypothetical protein